MKKLFVLLFLTSSVTAFAADERQPVFIKARCEGLHSMVVLSSLTKSVVDSEKYRLVSTLDDNGHFGIVHTIYMTCAENKDATAVATSYGIAKCQSSNQCGSVIDGESINVALCNASVPSADCGRALFKAFEAYMSIPNRPLRLQEIH
jgi:hypothetical protein